MKPLNLKFCGINSFSETVEIDFNKLTANGLFGIFGDTGSGKSTILDSINFALYGDVDRSKKKTDIINYNCDSAEVTFVFDILSDGERKKYTVERSIKKKSGLGKAMLYEEKNGESLCIADNTTSVNACIENILGLNAEDFRKCIALPQGEFAQFVKSVPSERFKLIERLFDLSKYGDRLKDRLFDKESAVNLELSAVEGELSAYAEICQEQIDALAIKIGQDNQTLNDFVNEGTKARAEYERVSKLYENLIELNTTEKHLYELESKRDSIEKLRKSVKILPVCKTAAEAETKLFEKREQLARVDSDVAVKEKELISVSNFINDLSLKIEQADFENKISAQNELLAKYSAYTDKCAELKSVLDRYKKLRSDYSSLAQAGKKLAESEKESKLNCEQAQKAYDECSKQDIRDFFDSKFKDSVLRGEYEKQLNYFGDLRESIKLYGESGELYDFLREELTERIKYYEGLILNSVGEKIDIDKKIRELQAAADKREKLADLLNDKKAKLAECSKKLMVNARECELIRQEGEEAAQRIEAIKSNLAGVFGENVTDYDGEINRVKSQITDLKYKSLSYSKQLEDKKCAQNSLQIDIAKLKSLKDAYREEEKQLAEKLKNTVEESGLNSIAECKNLLKEVGTLSDAEKTITEYDGQITSLLATRKKLCEVEGIRSVTYEQTLSLKADCEGLEKKIRDIHAEIKLSESKLSETTQKLVKKKELEEKLKEVTKRKNLVAQLKDLTKGNKFMEYIAGEYLIEISSIASGTLLKLTDGRYFITYTDNFYVGDNYNCGNLRGVNTLSGGETFLVSLSLALALSSVICSKSLKSIEFFFLDEGFGTLDENLIDTVMNALEKLKSSYFTIGIISHVEELKHRIDSKIIVNKATESHGSSVQVIA